MDICRPNNKSIIMKEFTIICLLILMYSCSSSSKNKESDFVEVKDTKIVNHQNDTENISRFNNDSIVGHWFQPHAAMINITFSKNGKFEFNTYDNKTMQELRYKYSANYFHDFIPITHVIDGKQICQDEILIT